MSTKGTGILRDPQMKKIRALMMMEFKIKTAASANEIAKEFGVSRKTVERTLSYAKKAGLLVEIEDRILAELMPAAHKAILAGLADSENPIEAAKIGMDLLKAGVPMLKKTQGPAKAAGDDELDAYIAQLRADGPDVIDADELPAAADATLLTLPPAAQTPTPQGDASPARGDADGSGALAPEPTSVGISLSEGS
jgi:biotin operon repressor